MYGERYHQNEGSNGQGDVPSVPFWLAIEVNENHGPLGEQNMGQGLASLAGRGMTKIALQLSTRAKKAMGTNRRKQQECTVVE